MGKNGYFRDFLGRFQSYNTGLKNSVGNMAFEHQKVLAFLGAGVEVEVDDSEDTLKISVSAKLLIFVRRLREWCTTDIFIHELTD